VTATLREWEMACRGPQLWHADATRQWVLAAPRGRSIMAAEKVAGICQRGVRDVA
jgi:hypothetical protein